MPSAVKNLQKMRNNPRDWRIEDLLAIAKRYGIETNQHGTSHVVFRHPAAGRVSIPAHRPIRPEYIRQFVQFIDRMETQP